MSGGAQVQYILAPWHRGLGHYCYLDRIPPLLAALASHLYDASSSQASAKMYYVVAEGSCTTYAALPSPPSKPKHRRRATLALATSEGAEGGPGSEKRSRKTVERALRRKTGFVDLFHAVVSPRGRQNCIDALYQQPLSWVKTRVRAYVNLNCTVIAILVALARVRACPAQATWRGRSLLASLSRQPFYAKKLHAE
jgi:hypothetical protein